MLGVHLGTRFGNQFRLVMFASRCAAGFASRCAAGFQRLVGVLLARASLVRVGELRAGLQVR
jgi:hypothetical protein